MLERNDASPNELNQESTRFGFFFQAEDGIRDVAVTGVQTCALPISAEPSTVKRCGAGCTGQSRAGAWERVRLSTVATARRTKPSICRKLPALSRPSKIGRASCRERV